MSLVKSLLLFICLLLIYLFVVNATCRIDCSVEVYRPWEPYCYLNDDGSHHECYINVTTSQLNVLTNNYYYRVKLFINSTNTVTRIGIESHLAEYKLEVTAFRVFPQITKLEIRYNQCIVLYSTLSVLPNLKQLTLYEVAFHHFPSFSFLNPNLAYLVLHKYRILQRARAILTSTHISGLSQLKYLYVEPLVRTPVMQSAFSGLSALTGLFIRNLQLVQKPNIILSPLRRLKALGIYQFELTSIEFLKETPWLYQLTRLRFWDNNITSFSDDLFTNYTELKNLGIGSNRISVINRSNFTKLGNLEHLSLQGNQITTIPHDTFKDMPLLIHIELQYNPITTLSSRVFEHLNRIKHIILSGHRLHCDCSLQWMSVVSQKYGIDFNYPYFYTPTEYRGRLATDLSLYSNCTRELSYDCYNSSVMCPRGSYCQDTIDSHLCVCEGEGVVFSKSLNRCVDFEKLIRASQGEFITDTNGYATFVPHATPTCATISTIVPKTCPTCSTTTTQYCPAAPDCPGNPKKKSRGATTTT